MALRPGLAAGLPFSLPEWRRQRSQGSGCRFKFAVLNRNPTTSAAEVKSVSINFFVVIPR